MSQNQPPAEATLDTRPVNPFALQGASSGSQSAQVTIASSRQAQEVQAAMVIAKKFPRDEAQAYGRIIKACQRKGLAEVATYAYPRGGEKISGPSIRLAEAMAQAWGNLDFGVMELDQKDGESTVMAYCWDLETNTRQSKVFQVRHEIQLSEKRGGGMKMLTDPRDIYELVANQGARRVRACILGIIPGDIVEAAEAECDKTMTKGNTVPLTDRLRKMALVFDEEFQVSIAMIEKRLGHKLDVTTEREFVTLRKIYTSLRDGMSKKDQWFDVLDTVKPAEVSPTTQPATQEAGQASDGPGPASSVPNETLGAPKPRAPRKPKVEPPPQNQTAEAAPLAEAPKPEPAPTAQTQTTPVVSSRPEKIRLLRDWMAENGVREDEFLQAAGTIDVLVTSATKIDGFAGDVLQILIDRYSDIINAIN